MGQYELISKKIVAGCELTRVLKYAKLHDQSIVFTNGCFDIIHRGHIDYLAKASDLGDLLFIGLNTDNSVRKLKGNSRPIQDEHSRAMVMAAFKFISYVVLFDEETPFELIKIIQPDVLVKGGDYIPENIVGYDIVKAKGGYTTTIPFVEGFSTSGIIGKIDK
jgi:rfaE bifunctional protein nucleotidyltransferase chain/domain